MNDYRLREEFHRLWHLLMFGIIILNGCVGRQLPSDPNLTREEVGEDIPQDTKQDVGNYNIFTRTASLPPTSQTRQGVYYNPSIMDGKKCDRKSVQKIIKMSEVYRAKKHYFKGCIIASGEQAMISNSMETPVNIGCMRPKSIREQQLDMLEDNDSGGKPKPKPKEEDILWLKEVASKSDLELRPNTTEFMPVSRIPRDSVLVLNVYVDPEDDYNREAPKWMCIITRVDRGEYGMDDRIFLDVFSDYTKKETFLYDITTSGVYEGNPRLVKKWTEGSSALGPRNSVGSPVNFSDLFPRSPGADLV